MPKRVGSTSMLPDRIAGLFWDTDASSLHLYAHRDFIIKRVLDRGDWDAVSWLRNALGDAAIRDWFLAKHGGGLDARKLRFWAVILDLPKPEVDEWVSQARSSTWHGRAV